MPPECSSHTAARRGLRLWRYARGLPLDGSHHKFNPHYLAELDQRLGRCLCSMRNLGGGQLGGSLRPSDLLRSLGPTTQGPQKRPPGPEENKRGACGWRGRSSAGHIRSSADNAELSARASSRGRSRDGCGSMCLGRPRDRMAVSSGGVPTRRQREAPQSDSYPHPLWPTPSECGRPADPALTQEKAPGAPTSVCATRAAIRPGSNQDNCV